MMHIVKIIYIFVLLVTGPVCKKQDSKHLCRKAPLIEPLFESLTGPETSNRGFSFGLNFRYSLRLDQVSAPMGNLFSYLFQVADWAVKTESEMRLNPSGLQSLPKLPTEVIVRVVKQFGSFAADLPCFTLTEQPTKVIYCLIFILEP